MNKEKKTWAGVEIVQNDNALIKEMVYKLEERMDKLEELIRYATGPCNACNGTGMIYIGSETEGRSLPDPCEYCRGSGKTPLDIESMMEKFKEEARKEVSQNHDLITGEEIPF